MDKIKYPDIAQLIKNKIISDKKKTSACNSVWASEAGHDCKRYLVYQQCDWDKAKPADENLLLVFHEGSIQEDLLLLELQKAGIKIKDLQISIKIAQANITGKLDCVAIVQNNEGIEEAVPIEIKSMSDIVYNSVNTVEDFKKYPWTRKYYAQMMIYLKNDLWFYPRGYFLAKNKSTGAIKLIKDYDGENAIKFNEKYWNELIDGLKEVNKAVWNNKKIQMDVVEFQNLLLNETDENRKELLLSEIEALKMQYQYPDRIKYDLKVCKGCKYEHICITDLTDTIGSFIENKSIIEAIEDYIKSKAEREKYKEAEKKSTAALNVLKEVFPLKDTVYLTEKNIIQTKIRKMKNTEYLAFEIKDIEGK